mgnify:CR=1 FL=1
MVAGRPPALRVGIPFRERRRKVRLFGVERHELAPAPKRRLDLVVDVTVIETDRGKLDPRWPR